MQLHELRPKRIGRGGKRGTYSGRGIKGQKSRAGRKMQPVVRELIKRYPKLRGYKVRSKVKGQRPKVIINLEVLEKKFSSGEKITPEVLLEKGIFRKIKGRIPGIKILGKGKLTKSLTFEGCQLSKSAREKIEKAGGVAK